MRQIESRVIAGEFLSEQRHDRFDVAANIGACFVLLALTVIVDGVTEDLRRLDPRRAYVAQVCPLRVLAATILLELRLNMLDDFVDVFAGLHARVEFWHLLTA